MCIRSISTNGSRGIQRYINCILKCHKKCIETKYTESTYTLACSEDLFAHTFAVMRLYLNLISLIPNRLRV